MMGDSPSILADMPMKRPYLAQSGKSVEPRGGTVLDPVRAIEVMTRTPRAAPKVLQVPCSSAPGWRPQSPIAAP